MNSQLVKDATALEKKILDLEEKYMKILLNIFKSESFKKSLFELESSIQSASSEDRLSFGTNPIALPFERLIHFHMYQFFYKEKKFTITKPYPSPISSDIALILGECVLCIDAKTDSYTSNAGDLNQLQTGPNQINFENKPVNGGWEATVNLEKVYGDLPVLTFFLHLAYKAKPKKQDEIQLYEDFSLLRPEHQSGEESFTTLSLTSYPNGSLSRFFAYDLVYGFKTYPELGKEKCHHYGIKEKYEFTDAKDGLAYSKIEDPDEARAFLNKSIIKNEELKYFLNGKDVFSAKVKGGVHWKCNTTSQVYKFKILGNKKNHKYVFMPAQTSTARTRVDKLKERYDSFAKKWVGHEGWDIS